MDWNNIPNKAIEKVNQSIGIQHFPHITKDGRWVTTENGYWTGGFWVGLLWLTYKITGDRTYEHEAYNWAKKLEGRRDNKTFDLGFLFYPSFVVGYEITKDSSLRKIALEAANTLSTLFNKKSGFIYDEITINDKRAGRTIIDVMMNLPLLWWACEETDDEKYYNIAYTHSKRTIEEFIRGDYWLGLE